MNTLQPPEKIILEQLKPVLKNMRMLDIGVGTGRTTYHFAGLVKEYVGIDYSPLMIDECIKIFNGKSNNMIFKVGDVVNLSEYEDNYFDFILFSFNGIDYLAPEEREKAFENILRVGKPGGYFCFSTHNIFSVNDLFKFIKQFKYKPKQIIRNLKTWARLKSLYPSPEYLYSNRDYVIFNDGSLDFSLVTYYVNPVVQKEELSQNYKNIKVFDSKGKSVNGNDLEKVRDNWLYFLCEFDK